MKQHYEDYGAMRADGTMVGEYKIIGLIGEGQFGQVLHCKNGDGVNFAMKKIRYQGEVAKETQALLRLNHPNIIEFIEYFQHGSHLCIVYEFCNKGSFGSMLQKTGPLPEATALAITRSVACALENLQSCNLVHRDIKPDNIFLKEDIVKLGDFGLCLETDCSITPAISSLQYYLNNQMDLQSIPCNLSVVGSPAFMAPEALVDPPLYSSKGDVYSLGLSLYMLLTGKLPIYEKTVQKLLARKVNYNPMNDPALRSQPVKELLSLMLSNFENRPSATELIRLIDERFPAVASHKLSSTKKHSSNYYNQAPESSYYNPTRVQGHSSRQQMTNPFKHLANQVPVENTHQNEMVAYQDNTSPTQQFHGVQAFHLPTHQQYQPNQVEEHPKHQGYHAVLPEIGQFGPHTQRTLEPRGVLNAVQPDPQSGPNMSARRLITPFFAPVHQQQQPSIPGPLYFPSQALTPVVAEPYMPDVGRGQTHRGELGGQQHLQYGQQPLPTQGYGYSPILHRPVYNWTGGESPKHTRIVPLKGQGDGEHQPRSHSTRDRDRSREMITYSREQFAERSLSNRPQHRSRSNKQSPLRVIPFQTPSRLLGEFQPVPVPDKENSDPRGGITDSYVQTTFLRQYAQNLATGNLMAAYGGPGTGGFHEGHTPEQPVQLVEVEVHEVKPHSSAAQLPSFRGNPLSRPMLPPHM